MSRFACPVFWITGLSGAGKTTLATTLSLHCYSRGVKLINLDGDNLREIFALNNQDNRNYTRTKRVNLAYRYGRLARELSNQGFPVVVSTISLFREIHEWNRKNIPAYVEIFLDVSKKELKRRDSKGLYSQLESGLTRNVAGFDLEIDKPIKPDVLIDSDDFFDAEKVAEQLFETYLGSYSC